jgi:hypothetical protein
MASSSTTEHGWFAYQLSAQTQVPRRTHLLRVERTRLDEARRHRCQFVYPSRIASRTPRTINCQRDLQSRCHQPLTYQRPLPESDTGMESFGGVETRNMWGLAQLGRWKWHDPDAHINTRLWVFSPATLTSIDEAAMIGYAD